MKLKQLSKFKIYFPILLSIIFLNASLLSTKEANSETEEIYKVGIGLSDRFIERNSDGSVSGFEIALWEEIAKNLEIKFSYQQIEPFSRVLEELKNGQIDIALAQISMSRDRADFAEFSHPYFVSSLAILTTERSDRPLVKTMRPLFTPIVGKTILIFIFIMFMFGNILWFAEQGKHSFISKHYFPGIFQAMWCAFAIQSTIGFGDIIPHRWIARLISIPIWICGLFLVAIITAQLLAAYTSEQYLSPIHNYRDLRGKVIATEEGSTAAKIADTLGSKQIILVQENLKDLYPRLEEGKIDAIIFDYPDLANMANILKKEGRHPFIVPGQFDQQMYSIAINNKVAAANPNLLERINLQILEFKDSGFIHQLKEKWFGDLGIR